jgi:S1-C subfamily serine protease
MATTFSPDLVADVVERISPSIVRVDAGHRFSGTGTAWSEDLVVTANHVVERDEDIEIGLDGEKTAKATVVGRDETTNTALLKVEGAKLVPAKFRSLDGLRVGNFTVALARPGKTVRASFGIVSVLGGEFQTRPGARIDRWLESDADISAGWSGGLLVDLDGNGLGVNNRGLVRQAHITVPHVTLERVVKELQTHGKIRRGYLGVGVHRVDSGLLVHAIEPKSHADTAGLLVGDVIVSIDGKKVGSPWELASVLREKVDAEVSIEIIRGGQPQTIKAHT